MRPPRIVPAETAARQLRASDPRVSAWVSANAGSGKTTVLTHRVIRLLLDGSAPSAILCLTFTKAAAANMQNRVFETLGTWATLDDAALRAAIRSLAGTVPDEAGLTRARRLFASAIETPGGLKILTIHAFCERVLHLFPFEANVPAQFAVLEERGAAELLDRARLALVVEANARPQSPLGRALARIVEDAGEETFGKLLEEVTGEREAIRDMLRDAGAATLAGRIRRMLGLDPGESVAAIEAVADDFAIPPSEWPRYAATLAEAGGKMADLGALFTAAAAALPSGRPAAYRRIFSTEKNEPRKPAGFLTKAVAAAHPALATALGDELARLTHLAERRKLAAAAERTQALLVLAEALIGDYEAAKRGKGRLDFDDLVNRTLSLLLRAGADWVLYKLDRGIDHILVDEAQDTSPKQWEIVRILAAEFTAGAGARGTANRSLFAVGDEKQSIFSFQGAAPAEFARMRSHFRDAFTGAALRFEPVDLTHSFRSTRDVLTAVDKVFADAANRRGLSSDDAGTLHETVRGEEPGRVEIWPVIRPDPAPTILAWDAPFDETPNTSPVARAAGRIAAAVATLIRDGDPATGARYQAGDVMVLVRSRNALFEAVIRALKQEDVPVAGADRIVLTDHIAVMDLVAVARFTLLPADDLTLATVLKTPLIGLDDDHLLRLAPQRRGSLWAALQDAAASDAAFDAARQRLAAWIDEAGFKTPFAFFSDLLARDGGRRAILARLGPEAGDVLDEFLGASADFERTSTPSLEGFVHWLAAARAEIKRDMDIARGDVRVMTVHGAKGLEARVVILADTCAAPSGRHDPRLFFVPDPEAGSGRQLLIWSPGKAEDPPAASTARATIHGEADAEHRRLLYVAMTRAEDRLIIAGHEGTRARPAGTWYDMVDGSLRAAGARSEPMPDGEAERLVFEVTPRTSIAPRDVPAIVDPAPEPVWLRRALASEASDIVALKPSAALTPAEDDAAPRSVRLPGDKAAAERGRLVHRLLQSLPDIALADRSAAARRYLAVAAPTLDAAHDDLAGEALAILADPGFSAVFAPGSRAEVPIVGRLSLPGRGSGTVSGRVDRLAVDADRVLIVDFKTNRNPPADIRAVAAEHVAQLALYRAVLTRLYPGRAVRAALVYTAAPRLIEVPESAMDAALAMLTA